VIHPTAIVHPDAILDPTVEVGPYAVIDGGVQLGPECIVGPHVHLTGQTRIGTRNRFHTGCVIGDAPQDLKYQGAPSRLEIGDDNVFREHVTAHRSANEEAATVIGSQNFFMAQSHVAHNCRIGNQVIIANGALLGGHVSIGNKAFISGNCLVHQFVRVGMLALMQGGAGISKDLPPFTVARGDNALCGLNIVGLRRAGLSAAERLEIKSLYHLLFRSPAPWKERVIRARATYASGAAAIMIQFLEGSQRGVLGERKRSSRETASEA